jgi:LysR family hydrogen peroxide-inducible transcriptional activator
MMPTDVLSPLPVSLRQLQYVVAVADLGGFRRAADACHVAQPSLSAQVALAERTLGVQLFERNRRRVRVLPAAEPLVALARRILIETRDLQELARQRADPFQGTLRLGVIPTICPYLLPDVAPILTRDFPKLTIIWSEDRTSQLVRQVKDGALEGAVLALESDVGGLSHAPLGWDPFFLAVAPTHPLARTTKRASPALLKGLPVLLLDEGHCFREQALELCARTGAGEMSFRGTSLATLVQMASAGTSVTLLPSIALPVENRRGQLIVRGFTRPGPGRTLALAWRRGSAFSVPLTRVAETIRAAIAALRPTPPKQALA